MKFGLEQICETVCPALCCEGIRLNANWEHESDKWSFVTHSSWPVTMSICMLLSAEYFYLNAAICENDNEMMFIMQHVLQQNWEIATVFPHHVNINNLKDNLCRLYHWSVLICSPHLTWT